MCFEILGFDIFLDEAVKPWLLEVNSLASFATDSPLDRKIKAELLQETFSMLNLSQKRKRQLKKERSEQFNRRQQIKESAPPSLVK
jgi:tubulin polyglutamylase TTLL6/13